mgnify:CR=1 FL=1
MLCLTDYRLSIFFRLVARPLEACGEHADFLEAVHLKILALAPPHSPGHPRLDKFESMFG